jgi:hypothetical protein
VTTIGFAKTATAAAASTTAAAATATALLVLESQSHWVKFGIVVRVALFEIGKLVILFWIKR